MNKKSNKMNYQSYQSTRAMSIAFILAIGFCNLAYSQTPTVTTRFANPTYSCATGQYCVDVEFQSDTDSVELFGMNVRFFYDDEILELDSFGMFQGGYGPVSPDPPTVIPSIPGAGFTQFGFGSPGTGVADFVNGAIQLLDDTQTPIYIDTAGWTKLFQVCFTIDDPAPDSASFCPPIVWDLEVDPANGGFPAGDDGVVITIVAPPPTMSSPVTENVVQFNWMYVGDGITPPFGTPVELECISLFCTPSIVCPANITIECDDSSAPINTGTATADTICLSPLTITFSDITIPGACLQEYTINRSWIATNECLLSDTCVQIITVVDTTGPQIFCPSDITLECTDSVDPMLNGTPSATDNCDPNPVVTYTDITVAGICAQEYVITRIWSATDNCGNSTTCTQTLTINDDTPPLITCPANITIQCDESSLPVNTGTAVATDNCDMTPTITFSDVTTAGQCAQAIAIQRTWTATDDCGNSTACIQLITVQDTVPPTIICPVDVTVSCFDSIPPINTGQTTIDDNCGAVIVMHDFDQIFNMGCINRRTILRVYRATDQCGNTATCTQVITVNDQTGPMITCPADVTINCNESTATANTGTATATDNCNGTSVITFSDVTVAGGCPQESTISRTWVATDICGNSSSCLQLITIQDTLAPSIICPANTTIECDESSAPANTGTATASDLCDGTPAVTFSDVTTAGSCPQEYTISRTWTATDDCGNTNTCVQAISVEDNTSPTITFCPPSITVECDESTLPDSTGFALATDNCDPAPVVTYSDVTSSTGGSCPQEYVIVRVWTATDACGNGTNCTQVITVDDSTPPVITCPADLTIECDESSVPDSTGFATATDNCDPAPVVTFSDVTTSGSCPQEYFIIRVWLATDACGNSTNCTQVITVQDTTPPTIVCPVDVVIECDESILPANTGTATATDNCDTAPTVSSSDVTAAGTCAQEYSILRTWTATDACGNTSTCAQNITIEDTTPPAIVCPGDVTIECTDSTSPDSNGSASATDNCDPQPAITFNDVTAAGSCAQEYSIDRTWTATDACGNSSTCLQTLLVEDTTPPSIVCPASITIECDESTSPDSTGIAVASDNCDPAPVVTFSDVTTAGSCPQEYVIVRVWTATDACGNGTNCTQVITVDDTQHPVVTCPPSVTIECDESTLPDSTGIATATDNCDPNPEITFEDFNTPGSCPQEYVITRLWTTTDSCGNGTNCTQIITVQDNTPPTIVCPVDVVIECDESTLPDSTGTATASDNCDTAPTVSSSDVTAAGSCAQEYSIIRTWVATDACGNSSTCIQNITIEDTTAPLISCPGDVTIECTDSTSPDATGGASATDNCDPAPAVTFNDVTTAGSCPQEYSIDRTWTATDACGNSSTCLQTLLVEDTTPPSISCPPSITVECDDSISPDSTGIAVASDNCDPAPAVTFSDVTTAGSCPQEYSIVRTWIASDACGNSSACEQSLTIVDTTPPAITCPDDITIECDESTLPDSTGLATAIDNCDPNPTVDYSDEILGSEGCDQQYTILRTWTATDSCGNGTNCVQFIAVVDTTPPVITCPADVTVECSDVPDSTTLTYTDEALFLGDYPGLTLESFENNAVGLTSSIVTSGFTLNLLPTGGSNGIYNAPFGGSFATDGVQFVRYQSDANGTATFNFSNNINVFGLNITDWGDFGTGSLSFSNDAGDVFTVAVTPLGDGNQQFFGVINTGMTFNQVVFTQSIAGEAYGMDEVYYGIQLNSGVPTVVDACDPAPIVGFSDFLTEGSCAQEYTIVRTWTAADDCGNSSSCVQTISIVDTTPPVLTCPEDITIECEGSTDPQFTGFASATDACDPLFPSIDYSDVTIEDGCPEIIERSWTAIDACGNVDTCVQLITIGDFVPPIIICPLDTLVTCASDVPDVLTGGVTTSDNCGFVTVTHGGDIVSDSTCLNRFIISRVYVATDECGNTATCAQIITVFDNVPPMLTCPAGVTVSCASGIPPVNTGSVTTTDNCAGPVTVTHVGDVNTNVICANRFTMTRTYMASDACGNTATCVQVVIVNDLTPPSITCPMNVTVSCANMVPPVSTVSVVTSDNCGGAVDVTHVGDVITNQTCPNRFTLTRTYRATDACLNSATCVQIITVNDQTPPTLTCPANITVDFGADESPNNTGFPTVTDNCGGTPEVTFDDVTIAGICEEEYTIERTWTAEDSCGNISTCLQIIEVDGVCLIDLALTKVYIDAGPVEGGDDINFVITVTNEGEVSVSSVTITDYIPIGFMLNDPDWTPGNAGSTGQSASIVLSIANGGLDANGLNPGESVNVLITLRANDDIQPGLYFNTAEITMVLDMDGDDVSDFDIDSDPDDIDTNDPPGEDDIDIAQICVLPEPVISGDGYVCPEEVTVYTINDYNPDFTYVWNLNGGGVIVEDNGSNIVVEWQAAPGGPFQISVTVILGNNCQATAYFYVYIQGVETLSCNDHVQVSLGEDCTSVILSGVILEGEAEGNNNYYVIITDENGNVIPNATLTGDHVGQNFNVMVVNECNDQSCWGTISVEDKIPPVIECADVTVSCGSSLEPVFEPPVTGSASQSVDSGLPIGPNANDVTNQDIVLNVPANAVVTDVNITVDLNHSWSGDLVAELIGPNGNVVLLANQVCGAADNWDNVTFDDQAGILITAACNNAPPPALLSGSVIPEGSLAVYNGQSASGTWTLRITDVANADGGTLNLITLDVEYYLAVPSAPTTSDACGDVTLTYVDTETGEDCEDLIVTRVWTATDESGNTATCVQVITVIPLTLDNITFPDAYVGVCGESVLPDHTGWPTVNGNPITDENELCNIFVGYWDKELNECGGGRKIVRTWTILDWCTVEVLEAVQVIKLSDNEGPELTCPEDFEVGTDFWYCYANVSVPKPVAVDECSEVTHYSLTSTSGTVVSFGNNFVINGLGLGTHIVTWIVSDECGNSSTCSFEITVVDDVVPVALCDEHTIVSLTNDGPSGITLVSATVFDDGSYDNCGPVTFRARRMDSCIDFDWTTEGACIDHVPGGIPPVNSRDRGTVHRPCVPFACCDVGAGPIMVELEVTDASGNVNYCMIEAIVQDKISPFVECPPDIIVSCDFWFNVQEGTFVDGEGNNNGALDEDPLSAVFGNMYDAFRYNESIRKNIIINDPGNEDYNQPYNWGLDGWADDNCEVNLQVRVRVIDDCSGGELPGNAPAGAVKLIERRFSASDGNDGVAPGTCTQRIWVVDYDPFFITDQTCNNPNPQDGVIWPCDVLLTTCPEDLGNTGEPTVFDDACSLIGVTYEDTRFDFVDSACFKILREWAVIDWCQYDSQTGEGIWHYTQVIKVLDEQGPEFVEPCETVVLCVADPGVSLPDNNQAFLGEDDPLASSCSVHLALSRTVHETCSEVVEYDVKIYPFNGTEYILIKATTAVQVDENNDAVLSFDTRQSTIQSIRLNGLPYNSPFCGDYHRILWSVEDGCGNWSHCEYLFRLEDCKLPSPVCINGLSTVVMPIGGEVTVWAKDFNASSFDDCTPSEELLYSFSGTSYEPSHTYDCDNVLVFNVEIPTDIWVADGGVDHNCNGQIEWSERNKDFCSTTIVITDNLNVCGGSGPDGSILAGDILTEHGDAIAKVNVTLTTPGHFFPLYITAQDGKYSFGPVPFGEDYTIHPERNDQHRNGVSTLDLVEIQKHLLGKQYFTSPYQYIAADANNSQTISAIDLIEIRKLILGIYVEFPLNTSWRFVEKGFPMNVENPWPFNESIFLPDLAEDSLMHNDFVGVKVGDVNNSAKANANQILPRNGHRELNIEMDAPSKVEVGDVIDVKLRLPESVEGLQWTLETEGLKYESIYSEIMQINDQHIGLLKDGIITMSWNADEASAIVPGQVIELRFIAIASGQIENMIRISSLVTEAEAYTPDGEVLDVKLAHNGVTPEFALYQNQPNPWNTQTVIGFDLPNDAPVKITVFDVNGKTIKTIEGQYKTGYNTITLSVQDLPATGVMYYKLESGEYSASKKMVLIK